MTTNPQLWTFFVKRIAVKATVEAAYNAWAVPAEIEKWFLLKGDFITTADQPRGELEQIKSGDKYTWQWFGHPGYSETGKMMKANGEDEIQFTFAAKCIVSVRILVEEGETIVQLMQENIPVDDNPATSLYINCMTGWTFFLANLKSYLEGGVDLRNKNEKVKRVINS